MKFRYVVKECCFVEPLIRVNKWINEYFDWLKKETVVKDVGEWIEESTPFLDSHNDSIQIYIKLLGSGEILMSDDGNTLRDLDFMPSNVKKQRLEIINHCLKRYGIDREGDELITYANIDTIYQKRHFFLQCIMSINDVMLPPNVKISNKEAYAKTVKSFFEEKKISYVSNIGIVGKSGISHSVDFIIPKRENSPEKIISTLNKPDLQHAKISTFNLIDIREGREDSSEQIVLLNDIDKEVRDNTLEIFKHYEILPIKWSERDKPGIIELIA